MENIERVNVGITHGDINGIGYEIIIKMLMEPRINDFCTPIVYGSPKVAAYHRKVIGVNNFSFNTIREAAEANPKRANIINCNDDSLRVELGKSTEFAGQSALEALEIATNDLKEGKIDVLVTAPINKKNIQTEQFSFPGHTEYLMKKFETDKALMLMVYNNLRIGVVTGHVPLSKVPELITEENILEKLRVMHQSLIADFAVQKPKIAVLGLNPHAGDDGVIGNEELTIIIPAIEKAQKENIMALGPYPADGFFGSDNYSKFDAILAMYHDQGLIAFKSLVPMTGEGVNYTAGLPFVRTSPAHGTAYEITGKNEASPNSIRAALYLACDIFKNRAYHKDLIDNALVPSEVDLAAHFKHNFVDEAIPIEDFEDETPVALL